MTRVEAMGACVCQSALERESVLVCPASLEDIDAVKHLADAHRHELGFVVRASLTDAHQRGALFVATLPFTDAEQYQEAGFAPSSHRIVGFLQAYFRRDGQVTLHSMAVDVMYRRYGIGRALVSALFSASCNRQMHTVLLRCPVDLMANAFYAALGFERRTIEPGKRRELVVWAFPLHAAGQ